MYVLKPVFDKDGGIDLPNPTLVMYTAKYYNICPILRFNAGSLFFKFYYHAPVLAWPVVCYSN